jgi:hypothetical protein
LSFHLFLGLPTLLLVLGWLSRACPALLCVFILVMGSFHSCLLRVIQSSHPAIDQYILAIWSNSCPFFRFIYSAYINLTSLKFHGDFLISRVPWSCVPRSDSNYSSFFFMIVSYFSHRSSTYYQSGLLHFWHFEQF